LRDEPDNGRIPFRKSLLVAERTERDRRRDQRRACDQDDESLPRHRGHAPEPCSSTEKAPVSARVKRSSWRGERPTTCLGEPASSHTVRTDSSDRSTMTRAPWKGNSRRAAGRSSV